MSRQEFVLYSGVSVDRTQLINIRNGLAGAGRGNLGVPLLLLVMMGMMMLPVPPFLLDGVERGVYASGAHPRS